MSNIIKQINKYQRANTMSNPRERYDLFIRYRELAIEAGKKPFKWNKKRHSSKDFYERRISSFEGEKKQREEEKKQQEEAAAKKKKQQERGILYQEYKSLSQKANKEFKSMNQPGSSVVFYKKEIKKLLAKRPKFKDSKRTILLARKATTVKIKRKKVKLPAKKEKAYEHTREYMKYKDIDYSLDSGKIKEIFPFVNKVLKNYNQNDWFTIKLIGEKVNPDGSKSYEQRINSHGTDEKDTRDGGFVKNKKKQKQYLVRHMQTYASGGAYSFTINKVVILIIPKRAGGCNEKTDRIIEVEDFKLISKQSKGNNCYFACVGKNITLPKIRSVKNKIRDDYKIQKGAGIPPEEGLKIFKKYRCNKNKQLMIMDTAGKFNDMTCTEKEWEETKDEDKVTLMLIDYHYMIVDGEAAKWKRCKRCYKMYKHKHSCVLDKWSRCKKCNNAHDPERNCNPIQQSYYQNIINGNGKNRYARDSYKEEKKDTDNIIHYDLETHTNNSTKTHTACVVGYTPIVEVSAIDDSDWCKPRKLTDMDIYNKKRKEYFRTNFEKCVELDESKWDIYEEKYYNKKPKEEACIAYEGECQEKDGLLYLVERYMSILAQHDDKRYIDLSKRLGAATHLKTVLDGNFNREEKNKKQPQQPGLVVADGSDCCEYKYITGDDCLDKFIDYLTTITEPIYLNAYNGANFDHYMIVNRMLKRGMKFDHFCLSNGSIIRAKYKNITFIDLRKHILGSLRDNLVNFNCDVKKGDFDYNKLNFWSQMAARDQKDCLEYLKSDVLGLKELYNKLNDAIYEKFKVNLAPFYSTSHATYTMWIHHLMKIGPEEEKGAICIPTIREEINFRASCFGGRCYKSKHKFVSTQREEYLKGKISFVDIDDYIIDADVVSLYPSVMQKNNYPIEEATELTDKDIAEWNTSMKSKKKCPNMAIFYIKYVTNKYLAHGILPNRTPEGLRWTLKDEEGYYTSVDVENALKWGYKIKMCRNTIDNIIGFYWKKTKPIFRSYIKDLFEDKKKAEKGTPQYALAKLFMNGLYGKCIQKPIDNQTAWCKSTEEFWNFHDKNIVTDVNEINSQLYVTGYTRDEAKRSKCITKPTQLGSFILAYSRKLMLEYMAKCNPYFDISSRQDCKQEQKDHDIYYTDTDAIQVHAKDMCKESRELGGIANDLGDGCKIIKGIWIAPKLYMLEYIKISSDQSLTKKEISEIKEGKLYIKIINDKKLYYHLRGKGVPKGYFIDGTYSYQLYPEAYEAMSEGQRHKTNRAFRMGKINVVRNSKQQMFDPFSIYHIESKDTERTLNMTLWNGRDFEGNDSVPLS